MRLEDYIYIFIKSLLITTILVLVIIGLVYIIDFDYNFAYYISDITGIPSDLSLTMMSAGFANEIILLMLTIEFGFIIYFIDKIAETKMYNKLKTFVLN